MTDTKFPLVLIGCSKTKLPYTYDRRRGGRLLPTEMYGGQLFKKRVAYAEARGMPWAVLSAEYGVWRPDIEMRPYDSTMNHKLPAEFAKWHASVEIHAGANYAHPLAELLRSLGVIVSLPCEGLGIGQQLALYTSGALSEVVT